MTFATRTDTPTLNRDDWEVGPGSMITPLNQADTLTVLRELSADTSTPTSEMRDAVARYRRSVISKDEAYAKR